MLQKPYNISLKGQTFDKSEIIKPSWQVSGDLSVAYQVKVYKNSDNVLVYDSTKLTSFAKTHSIPANSLNNGIEYKIQITIWASDNTNINSDFEIFQTSSRPSVTIPAIGAINSPSYNFTATYNQLEGVAIRSWIVFLYDSNETKIFQSDIQASSTIAYLFSTLKSNTTYKIEFQATSNKGLVGSSGIISFNVSYTQPNISINLSAENVENAGIKLHWKTIQIIGETGSDPIFIDGEKLDVLDDAFSFSEGFSVSGNFTLKLWFELNLSSEDKDIEILTLKGQNGTISLQYWKQDHKFHLFKDVYGYRSHNVSNSLYGNQFYICIQQIDGDMNIIGEGSGWQFVFLSNNQIMFI